MKNKMETRVDGQKHLYLFNQRTLIKVFVVGAFIFARVNSISAQVWQSTGNDPVPAYRTGPVMIGSTSNPWGAYLQVHCSTPSSHLNLSGQGPSIKFMQGYNTAIGTILGFATATNQLFGGTVANDFSMMNITGTGSLIFGTSNSERFRILPNGNIGIGITAPAYKLDVNGTIKSTGLFLPTGAALNKVLISDASGNATWQSFSAISTNAWPNAADGKVLMSDAFGNPSWQSVTAASINGWQLNGNTAGVSDFIGTTNANPLVFKSNNTEGFRVVPSGTVGINIGNVSNGLNSNYNFHKFIVYGHSNFVGRNDAVQISSPVLGSNGARHYMSFSNLMFPNTSTQYGYIGVAESLDSSTILQNKHLIMQAPTGANVGIGSTTVEPTEKLTVYGNGLFTGSLKATTISLTSGAGAGKVLTSDASGLATWQPLDAGGGVNFSLQGNEVTLLDPYDLRVRNKLKVGTGSLILSGVTQPGTINDIHADNNEDLYVQSDASNTSSSTFFNQNGGQVVIGSATYPVIGKYSFAVPTDKLYVAGNLGWGNSTLSSDQGGSIELGDRYHPYANLGTPYIDFHFNTGAFQNYNARIINDADGQLRVYADNGLVIDGKGLLCKEVCVRANLQWCDYVFDKEYKLLSLYDVEKYIQKHKHLPEIPAASSVEADGVNLSEMVTLQMKKIEELTLYTIAMQKQLDELKKELEKVKK